MIFQQLGNKKESRGIGGSFGETNKCEKEKKKKKRAQLQLVELYVCKVFMYVWL